MFVPVDKPKMISKPQPKYRKLRNIVSAFMATAALCVAVDKVGGPLFDQVMDSDTRVEATKRLNQAMDGYGKFDPAQVQFATADEAAKFVALNEHKLERYTGKTFEVAFVDSKAPEKGYKITPIQPKQPQAQASAAKAAYTLGK